MDGGGADIMSDKLITIEAQDGPFQSVFQRIILYNFLKDDLIEKECGSEEEESDPEPPGAA